MMMFAIQEGERGRINEIKRKHLRRSVDENINSYYIIPLFNFTSYLYLMRFGKMLKIIEDMFFEMSIFFNLE